MLLRRGGAVCGALALLFVGGCAPGAEGPSGQTVQPINGGTTDTVHTNIVGIVQLGRQGIGTCTGSLISPNIVLTARHCVSPLSGDGFICETYTDGTGTHPASTAGAPYPASNFYVSTRNTLSQNQADYVRVSAVLIPPNSTNVPLCGKDIALLRLATPITTVAPVEPRLDVPPYAGEFFTAVGYGVTYPGRNDSGTRRQRSGLQVQYVGAASTPQGTSILMDSELLANEGTCQGDSGGPPLDEAGRVMGVLSRGADPCSSQVYTRVDSYSEWIRQNVRASATGELPPWIDPPQAGTRQFGDTCRGATECVDPLACLVVSGQSRCTNIDCACPEGWICGEASAFPACVPDPNAPPPPPPPEDSGTNPTEDAGTNPTDDSGTPGADSGTPGTRRGGCSVGTPSNAHDSMLSIGAALAGVALVFSRRRRSRN